MSPLRNGLCHVSNIFAMSLALCRMSILRNGRVALSNFRVEGHFYILYREFGIGLGRLCVCGKCVSDLKKKYNYISNGNYCVIYSADCFLYPYSI